MSKPDDVSQDAWGAAIKATGVPEDDNGWHNSQDVFVSIARAIMAAKAEEREACAHIADSYIDPIDIAHHIRNRGIAK